MQNSDRQVEAGLNVGCRKDMYFLYLYRITDFSDLKLKKEKYSTYLSYLTFFSAVGR